MHDMSFLHIRTQVPDPVVSLHHYSLLHVVVPGPLSISLVLLVYCARLARILTHIYPYFETCDDI
jgi:hypothetical protein